MITKRVPIIILSLSILGIFIVPLLTYTANNPNNRSLVAEDNNIKDPVKSDFWNLTSTIDIDDSNPSFNWSKTENDNDWCNGSGTWYDPYVIENVTINGKGNSCIRISNSDACFIINNATLYNSSFRGITLNNASNGRILDSKIYNNSIGIWLQPNSHNNTISGNEIYNTTRGIEIDDSINNTIVGNKIIDCTGDGMWIRLNTNNTWIINNTLKNISLRGIYLDGVNNNTVFNNTVTSNSYAIQLSTSHNDTILNNTLNCSTGDIYLDGYNETLSGNVMNKAGIFIGMFRTVQELSSNVVETNNILQGKPVYYFVNKTNLQKIDFTNAGQIILINCNDSSIEDQTFIDVPLPIYTYYGKNNAFTNNTFYNGSYGFLLRYGFNFSLSNNTVDTPAMVGINFEGTHNCTLYNNTLLRSMYGIAIVGCVNNTLEKNTAEYHQYGIILVNCNNNTLKNNSANHNTDSGIRLQGSSGNKIIDNFAYNNSCGINLTMGSNYTLVSGNTLRNNTACYYNDSSCVGNVFINNTCADTPDDEKPPEDNGDPIPYQPPSLIDGFNIVLLLSLSFMISIILIKKGKKFRVIVTRNYI